jgi:lysophospholipase L1-like esterase
MPVLGDTSMNLLVVICGAVFWASGFILGDCRTAHAADQSPSTTSTVPISTVSIDDERILLAPYVWKRTGTGPTSRAEAAMPGAYIKAAFQGSKTLGLVVDGTANRDCPAESMPVIEYSIDEGEFKVVPLTRNGEVYTLPLAADLPPDHAHRLDLFFRAADLTKNRWKDATAHLRMAGFALDAGATLLARPARKNRAIGFGDSITEGVGGDGLFTSWQSLGPNNARATWLPLVATTLDCEYGQLGTGGQGMTREIHLPGLPGTWDRYDPMTSRLTEGRLLPEPDYIFCAMGTNDFDKDIKVDYIRWLAEMRAACPRSRFFCIVPPLGVHRDEIAAAVTARHQAQDARVHLIDTAPLQPFFRAGQGPTQVAYDGVHPSQWGQALLGALIAAEAQKVITTEK